MVLAEEASDFYSLVLVLLELQQLREGPLEEPAEPGEPRLGVGGRPLLPGGLLEALEAALEAEQGGHPGDVGVLEEDLEDGHVEVARRPEELGHAVPLHVLLDALLADPGA